MAKQAPKPAPKPAPTPPRRPPPPPPPRTAAPRPEPKPAPQSSRPERQEVRDVGRLPATQSTSHQVPAHLRERALQSQGHGVSKDAADNLVPLIYVLQELSPQTQARDPRHMEGAVAGYFWLRGFEQPFWEGENDGMIAQPCHFNKCWIEWQPNRGGFVARHQKMPDDATQEPDPQDQNKMRWLTPAGNILVETREHVVRIFMPDGRRVPFVIPFSSTGHTVSKGWMFDMNQKQVDGVTVDSTMLLYRLRTKYVTNKKGAWFKVDIAFFDWIGGEEGVGTAEDIEAGDVIYAAFNSGEKQVDASQYDDEGGLAGAGGVEEGQAQGDQGI